MTLFIVILRKNDFFFSQFQNLIFFLLPEIICLILLCINVHF